VSTSRAVLTDTSLSVRVFAPDDETVRACPDCDNIRSLGKVRQMRTPSGRANDDATLDDPERDIDEVNG